jgi:hypothetical protein
MNKETLEDFIRRESKSGNESVGIVKGVIWQREQDTWKTVCEETPPIDVELLVKSPEGIVHLSSWRESWHIFSCQAKSESSLNWKWKTI